MASMSRGICIQLVAVPTATAFWWHCFTPSSLRLSYCHWIPSTISTAMTCLFLRLTCSDTRSKQLWILACAGVTFISSVLIVFISYMCIISTILRMSSAEGRRKAFSTCSSHMLAVTIFYGTLIFMYSAAKFSAFSDTDKMASVFYTVIIPMLNP